MTVISGRSPVPAVSLGRAVPLDSGSLLEGERLGQFLLQKFIGGGGMGVVFRALDTTLNRDVAVKVLSRDQAADEEALRRFRNEAQSAARLNHDNIARVHYVGEDRGVHYIVFEFIEGVNLRDRVEQQGPLPLAEAISYTFQIAQALDHASQRDVIHRDIKPSNVLITPDGQAKLVDMGLARLNQVAQSDADLTASGVTLGTFDYISPEQARDPRSADVRSDLYSLGCSFFYMLTGRPPFPEGTVLQKLLQHQADHPPDPRSVRPDLPLEVTWILARLLAKNPSQRFQQPRELIVQLAALGDKLGLQLRSPQAVWVERGPASLASRWQHHLPWMVPLAALFLIVLALDYTWTPSGGDEALAGANAPAIRQPPLGGANPSAPAPPRPAADKRPAPDAQPPANDARPTLGPPEAPAQEPSVVNDSNATTSPATAVTNTQPVAPAATGSLNNGLNFQQFEAKAQAATASGANVAPPPGGTQGASGVSGANAASPGQTAVAQGPVAPRDGVLVVSKTEQGPGVYSSLHAACSTVKDGDTIELRFNGRMREAPITLTNRKFTIRAGDGFQPVILFRPEPNPLKYPPSMLTVAGGQLQVENVHFELDLPREVFGEWALVETRRADQLRFDRVSFTIRNASVGQTAYHAGVVFFDIKAPPGTPGMAMDPAASPDEHIVTIDLKNCVARGEGTLVRDNDLQPLRLHWDNGLLATSERLLAASGVPTAPRQVGDVQITLRHVTAMCAGGLALLTNSQDEPYQLYAKIHCTDSIVASRGNAPLVEQRGPDSVEQYQARVQWSGQRGFFDGVDVFWRIENGTTQTRSREMNFDEWRAFWAGPATSLENGAVSWQGLPRSERPYWAHGPQDYALAPAADENSAVGGASDGLDAGAITRQLAVLPPEQAAEDADRKKSPADLDPPSK
jgi:serine/threonine-protein kinase